MPARGEAPGSSDPVVLSIAQSEERLLITFDKDFGELVYRRGAPASLGIVLFRLRKRSPAYLATHVIRVLESRPDWSGHFSVVDENSIRMRRLR